MIPKIIHYCWFGGKPLPKEALQCIESWKTFLPGYEIKEWNESNFDVNQCVFTKEANKLKQYAFVSDYARFWILYNYGGIYFDTDVELIKSIDDIVARGAFTGMEFPYKNKKGLWGVNPGLGIGCEKHNFFCELALKRYKSRHFVSTRGSYSMTIVKMFSELLNQFHYDVDSNGVAHFDQISIYPKEYFCPKNYVTGELCITKNTRSIHHYAATWLKKKSFWKGLRQRFIWIKIRYSSYEE
jgi:hypothetical protein